jgi:uncharacterized protein (TIGR02001 family)
LPRLIGTDPRASATRLLLALALIPLASSARAEIGASLTIASQDRFRGYSVSDGYPAATLSLSYDDARGPYFEASVMAAGTGSDGVKRYRFEENVGYALRIVGGPTIDAGIVHADYSGYRIYGHRAVYTEYYAGLVMGRVSAHLHYAPAYFQRHVAALYGDVDASLALTPRLRAIGHVGLLRQTAGPLEQAGRLTHDWSVGAVRDVGRLSVQASLVSGSRKRSFYGEARHGGTALIFAATLAF